MKYSDNLRRYAANEVPSDLQSDEVQIMMSREVLHMISAADVNALMTLEYDKINKQKLVAQLHQEKMTELFDQRKKLKKRPRSKAELRAWMHYQYAMNEQECMERLFQLQQCYAKFHQLKLMRKGRLVDVGEF